MKGDWAELASSMGEESGLNLTDGSRVAVIGGGPAGSFFSYFLLDMADRMGVTLAVDIYEPRDFTQPAPMGCNMCGGIISESLVQHLATEGINLPATVVQRGIESYHLHTDSGSVLIQTPLQEKRIASVYRGAGPRDIKVKKWGSFDHHLQDLAVDKGARVVRQRVAQVTHVDELLQVEVRKKPPQQYELVAVATGVNANVPRLVKDLDIAYAPPETTKTYIREYFLGDEAVREHLGSAMHVFLLDIPRLEFAAIVPKGDYISICLLGEDVDQGLVQAFLQSPEVKQCLPPDLELSALSCNCSPRINVVESGQPFADRLVFIGDCATTRLYKDGIGGAYRTAKAAAATAILHGVSAEDFRRHYAPTCRQVKKDNDIGKLMFIVTRQIQRRGFAKRAVLRMTRREQVRSGSQRRMSMVLWDMFTGSAPYREVFVRTLGPLFWAPFLWHNIVSLYPRDSEEQNDERRDLGQSVPGR